MSKYFNVCDGEYYIDLDAITSFVRMDQKVELLLEEDDEEDGETNSHMIDVAKWELLKHLIEIILIERDIVDDKMPKDTQLTIPFKLAFNTLLKYNLLKKC